MIPAHGDAVFLKNGRILKGTILSQDRQSIQLQIQNGGKKEVRTIQKSGIRKISYLDQIPVVPDQGERGEKPVERKLMHEKYIQLMRREAYLWSQMHKDIQPFLESNAEYEPGQDTVTQPPQISTERALPPWLKSALYPGWGQILTGESEKGYSFVTLFTLNLAYGFTQSQKAYTLSRDFRADNQKYSALIHSDLLSSSLLTMIAIDRYGEHQKTTAKVLHHKKNAQYSLAFAVALYSVNLLDISISRNHRLTLRWENLTGRSANGTEDRIVTLHWSTSL